MVRGEGGRHLFTATAVMNKPAHELWRRERGWSCPQQELGSCVSGIPERLQARYDGVVSRLLHLLPFALVCTRFFLFVCFTVHQNVDGSPMLV